MAPPPPRSGPRFNQFITVPKVRVIDDEGENLGVMLTAEAIEAAAEVGLDLVEVSPTADPPVCKFLDVGKFKYEAQKKANVARKSQKTQEIKEIKMRPNIDDHDFDTKMKKVVDFINEGDKVKLTMRFRGREMSHLELGLAVLKRVAEQTEDMRGTSEFLAHTHGTWVASVIADGAPFVRLYNLVAHPEGANPEPVPFIEEDARRYAALMPSLGARMRGAGVRIVNMSWYFSVDVIRASLLESGSETDPQRATRRASAIAAVLTRS